MMRKRGNNGPLGKIASSKRRYTRSQTTKGTQKYNTGFEILGDTFNSNNLANIPVLAIFQVDFTDDDVRLKKLHAENPSWCNTLFLYSETIIHRLYKWNVSSLKR